MSLLSSHSSSAWSLIPFPHMGMQKLLSNKSSAQDHLYSNVQSAAQPSPESVFPSSHSSFPEMRIWSPQTVLQLSAVVGLPPLQIQPRLEPEQSSRQPSSPSQASPLTRKPSPQTAPHTLGGFRGSLVQEKPGSKVQLLLQPSLSSVLLSSHASSGVIMRSPHIPVHTEEVVVVPTVH